MNFSIFFGKLNASFFSMIPIYPYFSRSRNHPHEPTIRISVDCFPRWQAVFPDLQGCDSLSSTSSLESGEILQYQPAGQPFEAGIPCAHEQDDLARFAFTCAVNLSSTLPHPFRQTLVTWAIQRCRIPRICRRIITLLHKIYTDM